MLYVQEVYNRCGSCRHFQPSFTDRMGRTMGECRGKPTHPTIGAQEFGCAAYWLDRQKLVPGSPVPEGADIAPADRDRERRLRALQEANARDARSRPTRTHAARQDRDDEHEERPKMTHIPLALGDAEGEEVMDRATLKSILAEVLDEALGVSDAPMHPRFRGGKIIVQPSNPELAAKEIETDVLFRKIVGMRDKLRVLEQKVNASDLDNADKVQLQQYITACYGSMTTFNFLFRERDDYFTGQG